LLREMRFMKFFANSLCHLDRDQKSISNQPRQQLSLRIHFVSIQTEIRIEMP
jgi:hypothetical protein